MIRKITRVFVLVLALFTLFPTYAYAAMPHPNYVQDSDYISYYDAYVSSPGYNQAKIWFSVTALSTSDEVGVLTAILQETDDFTHINNIKIFQCTDYSNMIAENTNRHDSYVSEYVEHGHWYRAQLIFYVANNGGSDSRYCVTEWVYI